MKFAEICVRHPVFTVMLIAFLVTLGVFSYRGLAVDLFPKADPATINVEVALPGATPDEMVTGVVLPLEDAISSVSGIDEISVYATEGKADITCTFVLEREIEGAAQDVREKVAAAINRLPRETPGAPGLVLFETWDSTAASVSEFRLTASQFVSQFRVQCMPCQLDKIQPQKPIKHAKRSKRKRVSPFLPDTSL